MRKFQVFILFIAAAAISLSSCKKDDNNDDNNDPEVTLGSMSLMVDGSSWDAEFVISVMQDGTLTITGSEGNGSACGIILENVTATGTYQVGQSGNPNYCSWATGTQAGLTYVASDDMGSGTVTITQLTSSRAKGTFEFTGINFNQESKTITNGEFDVDLSFSN